MTIRDRILDDLVIFRKKSHAVRVATARVQACLADPVDSKEITRRACQVTAQQANAHVVYYMGVDNHNIRFVVSEDMVIQ